jgi:competence protein ComEC
MMFWSPFVFVRVIIFFIAGILVGIYFPDSIPEVFAQTGLLSLTIFYILLFIISRYTTRRIMNPGAIALAAIFLAGYAHLLNQNDSRDQRHFMHEKNPIEFYRAVIIRNPDEKARSWKVEAEMLQLKSAQWRNCSGRIILYFSKDDFPLSFKYGDVFLIKGSPRELESAANPGEFDYKNFLTFRNIYHQHFLKTKDAKFIGNEPPIRVLEYAFAARTWADKTIERFVTGKREQAIASALVLGVTDGLDNELLNAYAATGAMHVLSVSGLHVSIIYLLLTWMLKPLTKTHSGKWIFAIISFLLLWIYAFVTGLSPSVLRAVTMFSFMALARPWNRSTNIFNTLAVSAFCILLYDPFLIMSVGFQLSYLAVLGIVYLQADLYALWEPKARLWDEIWKITCVSIAAQAATFILGLLYFHQFPNYFLISNLLVIPISFVVLIAGLVLLAVSFIPLLGTYCGVVLTYSIKILNGVVFIVESFPFSLIENIYITTFQCWLLMAALVFFILMIQFKRYNCLLLATFLIAGFSFLQWQHFFDEVSTRRIVVYKVPGHSAIDLMDHGKTFFITDSLLKADLQKIRFHIRPNRVNAGIGMINDEKLYPFLHPVKGGFIMVWKNNTVLCINEKGFKFPENLNPDFLIISNNAFPDLNKIQSAGSIKKIIVDSSNSFYFADKLKKQADKLELNIFSIWHQGAFEFKF